MTETKLNLMMETKEIASAQEVATGQEPAEKETPLTILEWMTFAIEQLKARKKYAAVHTYTSTRNSFMAFLATLPLSCEERLSVIVVFTPGMLKAYEEWLRGQGKRWNTVSTYMRTLRAFYNLLCQIGDFVPNPRLFGGVYTKVESLTKRALTENQANSLMTADFELLPEKKRCVLAYFLLMFSLRGMPFIDLAYLRKQDLQGDCIVYCRHKTGRQIRVNIPRKVKALFEQFRDRNPSSTYLFPILNEKLKDDVAVYEYYQRALRRFNKQLQLVANMLLPGVKLSSYTPRHTWATMAFHHDISIGIISKALGHSSIKVTEIYLKPFEDQKLDNANDELLNLMANWNKKTLHKKRKCNDFGVGALLTK